MREPVSREMSEGEKAVERAGVQRVARALSTMAVCEICQYSQVCRVPSSVRIYTHQSLCLRVLDRLHKEGQSNQPDIFRANLPSVLRWGFLRCYEIISPKD